MWRQQVFLFFIVSAALSSAAVAGNLPRPMAPLGLLAEKGTIRLDGQAAPPMAVVFTGDQVTTGPNSVAVLKLGWGATVTLTSQSILNLPKEAGSQRLILAQGALFVRSIGARPTQVDVKNERISVSGSKGSPALCRIAALGGEAAVFAQSGKVEARGAGRPLALPLGQWTRLGAGRPPAGGQKAGSVTNEIPSAVRQPVGQVTKLPLNVAEDVDWNDLVQTLQTGRVRIALLDGSVLNVGARSQMRITEYNPQAQQTTINLTLGIMRAKVRKLTKPNSHFHVRTQTAVIGVVGTEFIVEAGPNFTRVWCIEGRVAVWNLNTAIAGKVLLHPSQSTTVHVDMPPNQPAQMSVAQINKEIKLTTVRGLPPAPPPKTLALRGVTFGETITSAVLSGVALSQLGSASSAASQASSNASAASSAANSALAAAGNAVNAATNAVVTTQNVLSAASPATPASCGCR
jgi:ferric-dicitrate binding protein FerR (iron transport regulator)